MMSGIEARVQLDTGRSLKSLIDEMIENDKSVREIANRLGISEGSVRLYAKKYGYEFLKKPGGTDWGWMKN